MSRHRYNRKRPMVEICSAEEDSDATLEATAPESENTPPPRASGSTDPPPLTYDNLLRQKISQSMHNDHEEKRDTRTKAVRRQRAVVMKALDKYISMQPDGEELMFSLQRYDKSKYVVDVRTYQSDYIKTTVQGISSKLVPIETRFKTWDDKRSLEENLQARSRLLTRAAYEHAKYALNTADSSDEE